MIKKDVVRPTGSQLESLRSYGMGTQIRWLVRLIPAKNRGYNVTGAYLSL